jgi:hypothetical protein
VKDKFAMIGKDMTEAIAETIAQEVEVENEVE